jgi:hypothetical protein
MQPALNVTPLPSGPPVSYSDNLDETLSPEAPAVAGRAGAAGRRPAAQSESLAAGWPGSVAANLNDGPGE